MKKRFKLVNFSDLRTPQIIYPSTQSPCRAEDVSQNLGVEGLIIPRIDNDPIKPFILSGKDNPINKGVRAEIGSIYSRTINPSELYQKIGSKDQDWKLIEPGVGLGLKAETLNVQNVPPGIYEPVSTVDLDGGEAVNIIASFSIFNNVLGTLPFIFQFTRDGSVADPAIFNTILQPVPNTTFSVQYTLANQPAGSHTFGILIIGFPLNISQLNVTILKF